MKTAVRCLTCDLTFAAFGGNEVMAVGSFIDHPCAVGATCTQSLTVDYFGARRPTKGTGGAA